MNKNKKQSFWTIDIETRGFTGKFILGGAYNGKKYFVFDDEKKFMDFILNIKGNIFAHYLDFDFRTILQYCIDNNIESQSLPIMSGDKRVIYWKVNEAVFRDSFTITKSSLKDLADSFNLKTKKIKVENYQFTKKTKKLEEYLENDVIALYKIITKLYDFIGWNNFNKKTIASVSMEKFKEIDKQSYKRITEYSIYKEVDIFLRQAYFSGYHATFKSEIEGEKQNILKIDINSYYASVMRDHSFPWGAIIKAKNEEETHKLITRNLGIIQAKAVIPNGLKFGFLPIKTEDGVDYPIKGTINGVWTTPEIKFAEKLGYRFNLEKAIFWQSHDYLFRKYINYLSKIKEKSRGAKRVIAKQLLVSLYGKFAQRRDISILKHLEKPIPNRLYLDDNLTISEETKYIRTPYSHPEISIFTTAWARIWMYDLCQKIGFDNIYAIINDSLILVDNLSAEFKKEWIHPTKIGKFKIVSNVDKGIILGRGVYAIKDKTGEEIIRNQGGLKEFNKLLTYKDFEKIKKSNKKIWNQYDKLKRPKTIYSYLKNKGKLKEESVVSRKVVIKQ